MQRGSVEMVTRKEGPAVWQFRWSEKDLHGARVQRKRVIDTVARYQDEAAARTAIAVLLAERLLAASCHQYGQQLCATSGEPPRLR